MPLDDASQTWLAILDQLPVGVTVVAAPDGQFILQNSAARRILGRPLAAAADPQHYAHYDGGAEHRPYETRDFPLTRAVLEGEAIEREPLYYRHPSGRTLILEVNASRITAADGRELGICTFQDVTDEYQADRALMDAAERVQLALDAGAIVGTWVWDVPNDTFNADELFAHSFGLDPERCRQGISAAEPLLSIHPADRAAVEACVADALARGGPYRQQYRVRRPDGEYHWVEASGRVELDARGMPTRFPGVLLDISAWKQADEARTLLMREVDHRARNALAMVQSVVRLTDASDPASYRNEVVGRIDAMARAQGSLSRTNWQGVRLDQVIRDELSASAAPTQFRLRGPRLILPAAQVQPFNMIVHELATNSVKYGALSVPEGCVEISWRPEGDGFQLCWRERDGPPVRPPVRLGFGSRLMSRLAAQLGGAMAVDWRPAGMIATLTWRWS
jgi:PAS domain S-box-containing protein